MEEAIKQSFGRQKLMAVYGAEIKDVQTGSVTIRVPATDILLRTSGIFHGGVIAAVADTAAGYAAVSCQMVDAIFYTVEFKINFLQKAKGDWMEARASVIKKGRTLTIVSVDVFTGTQTRVATALVTLIKDMADYGNKLDKLIS